MSEFIMMTDLYEDLKSLFFSSSLWELEERGSGLISFPSSTVMSEEISPVSKIWRGFCKRTNKMCGMYEGYIIF